MDCNLYLITVLDRPLVSNHASGLSCIGAAHCCVELKCSILEYIGIIFSVYHSWGLNCIGTQHNGFRLFTGIQQNVFGSSCIEQHTCSLVVLAYFAYMN